MDGVIERFDTGGYVNVRPLPIGKLTEFVALRPKLYAYRELNKEERM